MIQRARDGNLSRTDHRGWRLLALLLLGWGLPIGCGGGVVIVIDGELTPESSETTPIPAPLSEGVTIRPVVGSGIPIGSSFPPDIVIPSNDRAWVVTSSPPAGIFRFDLSDEATSPSHFFPFPEEGSGIADGIAPVGEDLLLVTMSGHDALRLFDTSRGAFTAMLDLEAPIEISPPAPDSEGRLVSELEPSFTAGAALVDGFLYVVTSNLVRTGTDPAANPGTVLIFEAKREEDGWRFLPASPPAVVTSGFNPTEITFFSPEFLLVTNTGLLAIEGGESVVLSPGSVDLLSTRQRRIVANFPLGMGGPAFQPLAITPDRRFGFLVSAAYREVYQIDLSVIPEDFEGEEGVRSLAEGVVADHAHPIRVGGGGKGFLPQIAIEPGGRIAFVTDFEGGTLHPIDLGGVPARSFPQSIRITDPVPASGEIGPGPLAFRPGIPHRDFTGPDLFVLTGFPTGFLVPVTTNIEGR
ncbi:MAG: hypothetical protein D6812_17470 [Deltaproteobacteria bacterium]|nr:MAG: hypothetical protein D6812_17470 [Deltaproteobacteria bacterium]